MWNNYCAPPAPACMPVQQPCCAPPPCYNPCTPGSNYGYGAVNGQPTHAQPLPENIPENLKANESVLGNDDYAFALKLVSIGQEHFFESWPAPGTDDDGKRQLIAQARKLDGQYPGGLEGYCNNARQLLAASKSGANPYDGFTVEVPTGKSLTPGSDDFHEMEAKGMEEMAGACFVLVAGGMGERLGYKGIKVELPTELVTETCFLDLYCQHILALQAAAQKATGDASLRLPLCIMTSGDTHPGTVALLEKHKNFGMEEGQITLVQQEKVPSLTDNDAHIALESPYSIETKPHGHGDVHLLLHMSGTAKRWRDEGRKWVLFFQDTNGLVFRAVPASIGVSATLGLEVNSMTVPRSPGEAVGAICRLRHPDGRDLTLNVEYNQLDPLLRATVSPEGDKAAEGSRFSPYPGNTNVLVFSLAPYVDVLEKTQGTIAEFVNPKYKDDAKTVFKKPTRLECMMQDYPKLLGPTAKVGFTQLDRWVCFSAVKNNITDAAAKAKATGFGECASSGEADLYKCDRAILAAAGVKVDVEGESVEYGGVPVEVGAKVVVRPSAGVTFKGIQSLFPNPDQVTISSKSVLVIQGPGKVEVKSLELDGALVLEAAEGESVVVEDCKVKNKSFQFEPVDDSAPVTLAMRGYSLKRRAVYTHTSGVLTGKVKTSE